MVRKANGSWRPCGDYRQLNLVTQTDAYPLPNILHLLDRLRGKKFFTVLDLRQAFYQVPMATDDIPKTAVTTPFGLFEFVKMPFGLRSASQTFQRLLDSLLQAMRDFAAGYIDDIIIYSDSLEEHLDHIMQVLATLRRHGLIVNAQKSQIAQSEVNYLGHLIRKNSVAPLPNKVKAIKKIKSPTNVQQLQRIFGMINYYRRFVPKLAQLAAPLHRHLKGTRKGNNKKQILWTTEDERLLRNIINNLAEATQLTIPDTTQPFILTTDASDKAIGAVLEQEFNGVRKPIAFFSRVLQEAERRYDTFGRELLAIYDAITHFKRLLQHQHFTIYTDHKPIIPLLSKMSITEKHPRRILQQLSRLSDYEFTAHHISGEQNDVADLLSRPEEPTATVNTTTLEDFQDDTNTQTTNAMPTESTIELYRAQQEDDTIKRKARNDPSNYPTILVENLPIIHKRHNDKQVPILPAAKQKQAFDRIHNLSHPGAKATATMVCSRFAGDNLHSNCLTWAKLCQACQSSKIHRHTKTPLTRHEIPRARFQIIHTDVVNLGESNGYTLALTIIDRFSRWLEVVPLRTLSAEETTLAIVNHWIARFGVPHKIITDRGTNFTSAIFTDKMRSLGATVEHTCAYNPRSNGMIERPNRELKAALRANDSFDNWTTRLPLVLLSMRTRPRESIGTSAAKIIYGEELRLPGEMRSTAIETAKPLEVANAVSQRPQTFRPPRSRPTPVHIPPALQSCKRVWLRNDGKYSSREPAYLGPFEVTERRNKSFVIRRGNRSDTVTVDRLKPVPEDNKDSPSLTKGLPSTTSAPNVKKDGPNRLVRKWDLPPQRTRTREIKPPPRLQYCA